MTQPGATAHTTLAPAPSTGLADDPMREAGRCLSAPRSPEEAFLVQAEYVRTVLLAHMALWSSLLTLPEAMVPAAEALPT